jgi:SAM-dependent methyltransferase
MLLHMPTAFSDLLPAHKSLWRGMNKASVRRSTRILDVGCGNGALLRSLERSGFTSLTGVDPFVERGRASGHVTITKGELADMTGSYGFILLSHSLEHMPHPRAALHEVARLTAPRGHVMIGLPVVNRSWAELRPDWIGLDPPRHLFIPSVAGLTAIAESVPGLRVRDIWFDATGVEFIGSALARARVPLHELTTGSLAPEQHFDAAQLAAWERQAKDYNRRGEAGTAAFLIEKVG